MLRGLTLRAERGKVTALLGPNGAGKTTFLRCCTGLLTPASGTVRVLGERPGTSAVAARIGLMPQSTGAWSGIKAGGAAGAICPACTPTRCPSTR